MKNAKRQRRAELIEFSIVKSDLQMPIRAEDSGLERIAHLHDQHIRANNVSIFSFAALGVRSLGRFLIFSNIKRFAGFKRSAEKAGGECKSSAKMSNIRWWCMCRKILGMQK